MAVVGGFFALTYLTGKLQAQYNDINGQLTQQETSDQKTLESTVLNYKRRLDDFSEILNKHAALSRFFAAVEPIVYPTVSFDSMDLNSVDKTVTIIGKADTFESLAKQVTIFKNATAVFEKIDLSKVSLGPDGKINFSFKADIQPDAILFK